MAYASAIMAGSDVRVPSVAMPHLRSLRLSPRTRALLMMGIMISPAFLADDIGYGVQRLFKTADQIAEMQAPDSMLTRVRIFQVACPAADTPTAQQERWTAEAALNGWLLYPEAGEGCFKPERNLYGIVGLKVFGVACPKTVLSAADQRRWVAYAANHEWAPYPQAGDGCVDP
jgi:hypothetical protein